MKRGVLWMLLALLVGLAGCSQETQKAPAQADEPPAGTPRARRRFWSTARAMTACATSRRRTRRSFTRCWTSSRC